MGAATASKSSVAQSRALGPAIVKANWPIFLLVAAMPLQLLPFMSAPFLPIPGFTLAHFVEVIPLLNFVTSKGAFRIGDRLERNSLLYFSGYILIFFLLWWRSLPHLATFNAVFPKFFMASPISYLRDEFVTPVLWALSFVYVVKRLRTQQELEALFGALIVGITLLTAVLLGFCIAFPQYVDTPNRAGMTYLTLNFIGIHYTDIGTIYLLGAPFLLYMMLKRGGSWLAVFVFALAGVLVDQARTAILLFGLGCVAGLVALGKGRMFVQLLPLVVAASVLGIGTFLMKLMSQGVAGGYGFSWHIFLNGRDTEIWLPLLLEWWVSGSKFWFGAGLHSLVGSNSLRLGLIYPVAEAHNMFIEVFLDGGLVLLGAVVLAIILWLGWALRSRRTIRNPAYSIALISLICFLIAALTGRHFFPNAENSLVFPILGAMINFLRLERYGSGTAAAARHVSRPAKAIAVATRPDLPTVN
jgi:hypothetical protein